MSDPSPFSLLLPDAQATQGTLRVGDDARPNPLAAALAAAAAAAAHAAATSVASQQRALDQHRASRALANVTAAEARRKRDPLQSLEPPPLRDHELSLPPSSPAGRHPSIASPPPRRPRAEQPRRSSPPTLMSPTRDGHSSSHNRTAIVPAASSVATSSRPADRFRHVDRSAQDADDLAARDPPMATFFPVGEMTSPTRARMGETHAQAFTSPVRHRHAGLPQQQATLMQPQPQMILALSHAPPTAATRPGLEASAAALSMLSPPPAIHRPGEVDDLSAAMAVASAPPPMGSPKVSWSIEQWKAWAETGKQEAAEADAAAAAAAAAESLAPVATGPQHPHEQLLYPASLLLSPPRGKAPKEDDTARASSPVADASSTTLLARSPSPTSSPRRLAEIAAGSILASPPPSTIHSIAVQALRNLHARLLKTRTYDAWRGEWKRRDRLNRMLLFVAEQYERNFLASHLRGWLLLLQQRMVARADAVRWKAAEDRAHTSTLARILNRWRTWNDVERAKKNACEELWEKKGCVIHPRRTGRSMLRHWIHISTHYQALNAISYSHHTERLIRRIFFPWIHAAARSAVARIYSRRLALSHPYQAWRTVFLRAAMARALTEKVARNARARTFYNWHALLESRVLSREMHYKSWRRCFLLRLAVRKWIRTRIIRAWVGVVCHRREQTKLGREIKVKFKAAEQRRNLVKAWERWKAEAEIKFEANWLRGIGEMRDRKLRAQALERFRQFVSRARERHALAQQVVKFHNRQSRRKAVRGWQRWLKDLKQARIDHAKSRAFRRRRLIAAWRLWTNEKQLLASRTALMRLVQLRPFLLSLQLHAQFKSYTKRMDKAGKEFAIRRLGGVIFDDGQAWRGNAQAYKAGTAGAPEVEQEDPVAARAAAREAKENDINGRSKLVSERLMLLERIRQARRLQAVEEVRQAAESLPNHTEEVLEEWQRATTSNLGGWDQQQPFLRSQQIASPAAAPAKTKSAQSSPAARLPSMATASGVSLHHVHASPPLRLRVPGATIAAVPSPTDSASPDFSPKRSAPLSPATLAATLPPPGMTWSQKYPRSTAAPTGKAAAPSFASPSHKSKPSTAKSSPKPSVSFAAHSPSRSSAATSAPDSLSGQTYPIDHATTISAFPRSEFATQLPMKTTSASLLHAVDGLPAHGLPRPASEVMPVAWAVSEARRELLRPKIDAMNVEAELKLRLPLPPVELKPIRLPSGFGSFLPKQPNPYVTNASNVDVNGDPFASSLPTNFVSTMPARPAGVPSAFNATASASVPRSSAAPLAGSSLSATLNSQNLDPNVTQAGRGFVSRSTLVVDPVEARRTNRQKLEHMIRVTSSNAGEFYEKLNRQQQQQHAAAGRQPPRLPTSPLGSSASGRQMHSSDLEFVAPNEPEPYDPVWEFDESNYRFEQLCRWHYRLGVLRKAFWGWEEERGMTRRTAALEERVRVNRMIRAFRSWTEWQRDRRIDADEKVLLLTQFLESRCVESVWRTWRLAFLAREQVRMEEQKRIAARKVELLDLLAQFLPQSEGRLAQRALDVWRRQLHRIGGERRRDERLAALCAQFQSRTYFPHLLRPLLRCWRTRLSERTALKGQFASMLVAESFRRTLKYRTFHFLRVLTPVFRAIQLREKARYILKQRWRDRIRIGKAKAILRKVVDRMEKKQAASWWLYAAQARSRHIRITAGLAELEERIAFRTIQPCWSAWYAASSEVVRMRLHETLLVEFMHLSRKNESSLIFSRWLQLSRHLRVTREKAAKLAEKTRRKNAAFLSLQVAHLCHKFALLRRYFRDWIRKRAEEAERKRLAKEIHLPLVPVFVDSQGALLLHTDVPTASPFSSLPTEQALPFGVLYQPFLITPPRSPAPPPPKQSSPLRLMPSSLGIDVQSPLRNLVAPPERTPEQKRRDREAKRAAADAAATGPPASSPTSIPLAVAAASPVRSSSPPRSAGLHLDDLASGSPAKAVSAPSFAVEDELEPVDDHAQPPPHAAQSEMKWQHDDHAEPQRYAQTMQPQAVVHPATPQYSASLTHMDGSPVRCRNDGPESDSASPHQSPLSPARSSPHRGHVTFDPAVSARAAQPKYVFGAPLAPTTELADAPPHSIEADEPRFVGFALPIPESQASPHSSRRSRGRSSSPPTRQPAASSSSSLALRSRSPSVSPPRSHRTPVRTGAHDRDAPGSSEIFVPLRSILSSPEPDSPEPPQRFLSRSRFAPSASERMHAAAADRSSAAAGLPPPRRFHLLPSSASSSSAGPAAAASSSFGSYASIHAARTHKQAAVSAARSSLRSSAHAGRPSDATRVASAATAATAAAPSSSLLRAAFLQSEAMAAAHRAQLAQHKIEADKRIDRYRPSSKRH